MSEFGPHPPMETSKIKIIRTISNIRKDTESGKLNWKIILDDNETKVFSATIYYTESKNLIIFVRTSNNSNEKNDNSLKILYKIKNKITNYQKSEILTTAYLQEVPPLVSLNKLLWKKYLGLDYLPPSDIFRIKDKEEKSVVVEVNDVLEYRREILKAIKNIMMELDQNNINRELIYGKIYKILKEAEKSIKYNELNDFLYKASQIVKNYNPIGKPKWDTRPDDDDDQ